MGGCECAGERLGAECGPEGRATCAHAMQTHFKRPPPQLSDREVYDKLVAGAAPGSAHAGFLAARAELLLQQPLRKGLATRADCLEVCARASGEGGLPHAGRGIRSGDVCAGVTLQQSTASDNPRAPSQHLGEHFRVALSPPARMSNQDVGLELIKR